MHTRIRPTVVAAALLALSSAPAGAGVVSHLGTFDFGYTTYYASPSEGPGQSFKAIDTNILSVGIGLANARGDVAPSDPLVFTLYQGAGFGGPVLAQASAVPDVYAYAGFGYAVFETAFPAAGLVIGDTYTLGISALSDQLFVSYGDEYSPFSEYVGYPDGTAFLNGAALAGFDLDFIIRGETRGVPVPAPASLALFAGALLGLAAVRGFPSFRRNRATR